MEGYGDPEDKYLALGLILMLKQAGHTPEQISAALGVSFEEVQQQLASDSCKEFEGLADAFNKQCLLQEAEVESVVIDESSTQVPDDDNPTNIYGFEYERSVLHWTNLRSGEEFNRTITSYIFKDGSSLSELPDGSLLLTGGGHPHTREVTKIKPQRDFQVPAQPPMLSARGRHSARLHADFLYVIGGYCTDRAIADCERFICAENRWEAIPPLPQAASSAVSVVVAGSLYALGGFAGTTLDCIQKLSLTGLTWEVSQTAQCRKLLPLLQSAVAGLLYTEGHSVCLLAPDA
jgi:hypothetical protein